MSAAINGEFNLATKNDADKNSNEQHTPKTEKRINLRLPNLSTKIKPTNVKRKLTRPVMLDNQIAFDLFSIPADLRKRSIVRMD